MGKRILSAILLTLLIGPLVLLGGLPFYIGCGLVSLLALKEFLPLQKHHQRIPIFIVLFSFFLLLFLIYMPWSWEKKISLLLLSLFLPTIFYKTYETKDAIYFGGVLLFLGISFTNILSLRSQGIYLFLYVCSIPIFTDIFAMQIGTFFGKHKCCPTISPGKTWEGIVGGSIFGTILPTIFYYFVISQDQLFLYLLLTLFLSIVSQCGDLFFSKIKRENKIKDFGNLIPGHGGVMDRLDSLLFVICAYTIFTGVL